MYNWFYLDYGYVLLSFFQYYLLFLYSMNYPYKVICRRNIFSFISMHPSTFFVKLRMTFSSSSSEWHCLGWHYFLSHWGSRSVKSDHLNFIHSFFDILRHPSTGSGWHCSGWHYFFHVFGFLSHWGSRSVKSDHLNFILCLFTCILYPASCRPPAGGQAGCCCLLQLPSVASGFFLSLINWNLCAITAYCNCKLQTAAASCCCLLFTATAYCLLPTATFKFILRSFKKRRRTAANNCFFPSPSNAGRPFGRLPYGRQVCLCSMHQCSFLKMERW